MTQRTAFWLGVVLLGIASAASAAPVAPRQVLSADFDWRFALGDTAGAEAASFDDASWRVVQLPHDWSIESPPAETSPTKGGGGFFPAGVGWYRRTFQAPAAWKGKRISVEFDGIYRNATVYLNGEKLGTRPSGYSGVAYRPHVRSRVRSSQCARRARRQRLTAEQPVVFRLRDLPPRPGRGDGSRARRTLGRIRHDAGDRQRVSEGRRPHDRLERDRPCVGCRRRDGNRRSCAGRRRAMRVSRRLPRRAIPTSPRKSLYRIPRSGRPRRRTFTRPSAGSSGAETSSTRSRRLSAFVLSPGQPRRDFC